MGVLITAALLAGGLAVASRRRRPSRPVLVLAGLFIAGLLVSGTGVIHLPSPEVMIRDGARALGPFTYVLPGLRRRPRRAVGLGSGHAYFAGYVVEKSLSIDNLFVFVIIVAAFAVPPAQQPRALTIGIAMALVMRAVFIGVKLILEFVHHEVSGVPVISTGASLVVIVIVLAATTVASLRNSPCLLYTSDAADE